MSGGVASFVCQATGDPKPRVTWNKKGKKVNSQRFEVSRGGAGRGGRVGQQGGAGVPSATYSFLSKRAVAKPQDATRQPQPFSG